MGQPQNRTKPLNLIISLPLLHLYRYLLIIDPFLEDLETWSRLEACFEMDSNQDYQERDSFLLTHR